MRIQLLCTFMIVAACSTAPKGSDAKRDLEANASTTLQTMLAKDPGLHDLLANAPGYIVFPEIGKGGFVVGAAHGRGILYERGHAVGYTDLNQGSIGAQIGAQSFAELIVFKTPYDVQRLKAGKFTIGANASAVVLTTGAARSASFSGGVAVFTMPRGGVMAELSVSGQEIKFAPRG